MSRLHRDTITHIAIVDTHETDGDGVPIVNRTERAIDNVLVQPVSTAIGTNEFIGEEAPVSSRWRVSTSDVVEGIASGDKIRWRDEVFDVVGRPQIYRTFLPHTELVMVETRG